MYIAVQTCLYTDRYSRHTQTWQHVTGHLYHVARLTRALQFFRGRNEHLVAAVKNGRNALDTTWRGSFAGLAAILRVVTHMVTLQERMLGPRYDCFGPWPVCPDSIVRRYV